MKTTFFKAPILSPADLKELVGRPDLVILDATLPKAGSPPPPADQGVFGIPGARFFDIETTFSDISNPLPNTFPSVEQFENEAVKLGINSDSLLVIYDRHGLYSAARAWWMFRAMGHENTAVLDGGLPAWETAGGKTELLQKSGFPTGNFRAVFRPETVVDAGFVQSQIGRADSLILDARAEDRFYGRTPEPRANSRSGHIPGSQNLPFGQVAPGGKILPVNELKQIFENLGATDKDLICTCGSGVTACVLLLAAEAAGFSHKAVYDGSWSEWGSSPEFPVEC